MQLIDVSKTVTIFNQSSAEDLRKGKTNSKERTEKKTEEIGAATINTSPAGQITEPPKAISELRENILNLSPEIQENFNSQLQKRLIYIAGFATTFSSNNRRYEEQFNNITNNQVLRDGYRKLREEEQEKYRKLCSNNTNYQTLFKERIKIFQDTIRKFTLEMALLNEAIIGNSSYWNSFSFTRLDLGHRYGATFRLSEILNEKGALETRRTQIGIKVGEEAGEINEAQDENHSKIRKSIIKLSQKIDALKEKVLVFNEAMKKDAYLEVYRSDLPKLYYQYQLHQLEDLKKNIETLKTQQESRLQQLDAEIKIEISKPGPKLFALQQERTEIATRWEKIVVRQGEIIELLNQRKVSFNIPDEGLAERVKLDDFSEEMKQAFELLNRITSLKGDILLGNNWEMFAMDEQRRAAYFKAVNLATALQNEKSDFEEKTLPARLKVLNTAVGTYKGYITTMQHDMLAIQTHLEILEKEQLNRAKWQVESTSKV
jgi:hypothetical protein